MSKRLTRNGAYILGRKCILATNGCTGYSVSVDGKPIEKCGHNEGMLGWNWNAFQIGYGFCSSTATATSHRVATACSATERGEFWETTRHSST